MLPGMVEHRENRSVGTRLNVVRLEEVVSGGGYSQPRRG